MRWNVSDLVDDDEHSIDLPSPRAVTGSGVLAIKAEKQQ